VNVFDNTDDPSFQTGDEPVDRVLVAEECPGERLVDDYDSLILAVVVPGQVASW
jgi:hypothetical protein